MCQYAFRLSLSVYIFSASSFFVHKRTDMILHKHKLIFVHIPKNAGSSIETFFGVKPFDWRVPNYEFLTGWCPERCIHLHHATPKQLLETELISEDIWNSYYKFAVVRNSWERSLSDYIWMLKSTGAQGSFIEYLNKEENFSHVLSASNHPGNRADHMLPQLEFTHMDNTPVMDKIIRFENISEGFQDICKVLGIHNSGLPHKKKGIISGKHYSYFYNSELRNLVADKYHTDIKKLSFTFDNKRPFYDQLLLGAFRLTRIKRQLSR